MDRTHFAMTSRTRRAILATSVRDRTVAFALAACLASASGCGGPPSPPRQWEGKVKAVHVFSSAPWLGRDERVVKFRSAEELVFWHRVLFGGEHRMAYEYVRLAERDGLKTPFGRRDINVRLQLIGLSDEIVFEFAGEGFCDPLAWRFEEVVDAIELNRPYGGSTYVPEMEGVLVPRSVYSVFE